MYELYSTSFKTSIELAIESAIVSFSSSIQGVSKLIGSPPGYVGFEDAGYLTEHQSLTAYSTTNEVNTLINQSVSGKADTTTVNNITSALTAHTADTTIHVTQTEKNTWNSKVDSSTLNNYMLKTQIWCGTQAQYDAITTKDNSVIYLIHE